MKLLPKPRSCARAADLQAPYFLAVMLFALVVGTVGLLRPDFLPEVLPVALPALHARIIGALYMAGAACMLLAARAKSRLAVRTTLDLTGVWTGTLLVITALRWSDFDMGHKGLWPWLAAYVLFPIGAAWLRRIPVTLELCAARRIRQPWVLQLLTTQGLLLMALAIASFGWPGAASLWWPWRTPPLLSQVYAGPLLALGLSSLLLAQRRNWCELRIPCTGLALFAALALLALALHAQLLNPGRVALWCWLLALILMLGLNVCLALLAARKDPAHRQPRLAGQGAAA